MNRNDLLKAVTADHTDYLRDESRRIGKADLIAFPTSESEVQSVMAEAASRNLTVTIQGARTGISAGAVPGEGIILNVSRMKTVRGLRRDINGDFLLEVEPGVVLADLRKMIEEKAFDTTDWNESSRDALQEFHAAGPYFFTPDPTETSASIGGMVACNASGACSYFYGPTRRHVESLRIVLPEGDLLALRRGEHRTIGRRFSLTTLAGRELSGKVPSYRMPSVKNASGYFAEDDMDLVDLFIGSEGTLGVVTSIVIRLIPEPPAIWGITAFFPALDNAQQFVRTLRGEKIQGAAALPIKPVAIEFFDCHALNFLRQQRLTNPAFAIIPAMPPEFHTAIYVEFHGVEDSAVEEAVVALSDIMTACGGRDDATWIATDGHELERFKKFRHAVPEAVNLLIDQRRKTVPGLTKLGTDMAVPDQELTYILDLYLSSLQKANLEYVIFGHIGNNHVHVNILPRSQEDYEVGRTLYLNWAREVIRRGGSVSAEHGIGKLKVALLREMYGAKGIEEMLETKRFFDPHGRINCGNLF